MTVSVDFIGFSSVFMTVSVVFLSFHDGVNGVFVTYLCGFYRF